MDAGARLLESAIDVAPAIPGSLNGEAFEWLADADARFGPILQVMVTGQYYWLPLSQLRRIEFNSPRELHERVWAGVNLTLLDGNEVSAYMPVRYPGACASDDGRIVMASKTAWREPSPGLSLGSGQRLLTSPSCQWPLLKIREILFEPGSC